MCTNADHKTYSPALPTTVIDYYTHLIHNIISYVIVLTTSSFLSGLKYNNFLIRMLFRDIYFTCAFSQ